jgi:hypothetical protein
MPFEIREALPTPNPNAMKFVLDQPVSDQPMSFLTPSAANGHPLAQRLFEIKGVSSILLLGDFITVNKTPTAKWPDMKRKIAQLLRES